MIITRHGKIAINFDSNTGCMCICFINRIVRNNQVEVTPQVLFPYNCPADATRINWFLIVDIIILSSLVGMEIKKIDS
jgi:hypothetical protein